jgi:hypothetical protein
MATRHKGGRVSLTAFEAAWLRMVIDTSAEIAVDAVDSLGREPPRRVKADPFEAWDKIVQKVADVSPLFDDDD